MKFRETEYVINVFPPTHEGFCVHFFLHTVTRTHTRKIANKRASVRWILIFTKKKEKEKSLFTNGVRFPEYYLENFGEVAYVNVFGLSASCLLFYKNPIFWTHFSMFVS